MQAMTLCAFDCQTVVSSTGLVEATSEIYQALCGDGYDLLSQIRDLCRINFQKCLFSLINLSGAGECKREIIEQHGFARIRSQTDFDNTLTAPVILEQGRGDK